MKYVSDENLALFLDNLKTYIQANAVSFTTTAPTSDNTNGLTIVILSSEPATKYDGYIYLILGSA